MVRVVRQHTVQGEQCTWGEGRKTDGRTTMYTTAFGVLEDAESAGSDETADLHERITKGHQNGQRRRGFVLGKPSLRNESLTAVVCRGQPCSVVCPLVGAAAHRNAGLDGRRAQGRQVAGPRGTL
jgi:hypothetical protein